MRVEDRLIGGDSLADGVQFRACWLVGVFRRRQAAELQQAGHQQEASLVCGEIGGGDLEVVSGRQSPWARRGPLMATGMPLNAALSISLWRVCDGVTTVWHQPLNDEAGKQAETELVLDRGDQVDFRRGVVSVVHPGVSAVGRDGDDRNGAGEELAVAILDRDIDHLNAARTLFCSLHRVRQGGDLQLRPISVLEHRQIGERDPAGVADVADDAAVASGRHIAARTRVGLGDLAGGKHLLLLDHHDAATVAALLIGPDARSNEARGVHDVRRPVGADLTLRTLRRVAADRQGRVDQQVEPVGALFDLRAALGPDHAIVVAARHQRLHVVGRLRERRPRRRDAEVIGLVAEEMSCRGLPEGCRLRPCRCADAPADPW